MKVLCIARAKESYWALPPEKRAELGMAAYAMVDKYRKAGTIREIYDSADTLATVIVWDFASLEDGARIIMENPMIAYQSFETMPLLDFDVSLKLATDHYTQMLKK